MKTAKIAVSVPTEKGKAMPKGICKGESIFIPFRDGRNIPYTNTRPRIYKTPEIFQKYFPGGMEKEEIELVEYAPIVRCGDCKHFVRVDVDCGDCTNERFHMDEAPDPPMYVYDFCCLGERRTND